MKKTICPSCFISLLLIILPGTACTTKAAAEKPQDAPARQETSIGETAAQRDNAESAVKRNTSAEAPAFASVALRQDMADMQLSERQGSASEAVKAAEMTHTTETAERPAPKQPESPVVNRPESEQPEQSKEAAEAVKAAEMTNAATDNSVRTAEAAGPASEEAPAETINAAGQPPAGNAEYPAERSDEAVSGDATLPPRTEPNAEKNNETVAEADVTPIDPSSQPAAPDYEDTLAALISDFEEQGGSHGYEPPRSFHEEMLDLFSPQIFSVALSKEPETEQKVTVSRMVAVEEKQRVEIVYPGHGWVYIGEQTSQPGLKYEQRKLQDNNSLFMFTAEKKGDYVLHFSYFDVFTNDFITDAVAVSVSAARSNAAKSMVRAPEYKTEPNGSAEAQAAKTTQAEDKRPESAPAAAGEATAIAQPVQSRQPAANNALSDTEASAGNTGVSTEPVLAVSADVETDNTLTPEQILEKARAAIGAADAVSALQYLNDFFAAATKNQDEGWFLQGRAYELNGAARNIRLALNAYKTLTAAFPQSKYWAEADSRIRYITNFYISIQ